MENHPAHSCLNSTSRYSNAIAFCLLNPALTRSIRYRGHWLGVGCLKEKPFDLNATVYREKTCLPSLLRSTPYG
ncbi:Conserved hypothetical protein [Prochlorococcus marinus str. MIT 9303]|uniref:Uncharacterized protein n=1 Tax=Prochlorococcus marinus (strain MIT 9303) TaxID=59922 RepID=A2C770_PROM3|nr:Conserved hypothetical protein [Prochlorococcus marinus str. MIT 9303]